MWPDGSVFSALSTAWRIIAAEKSFQGNDLSGGLVVPSISIFFRPLCAPVMRRWSNGGRRVPVISHMRQASLAAAGSTMKSASLAGEASPPLVSPDPRRAANQLDNRSPGEPTGP